MKAPNVEMWQLAIILSALMEMCLLPPLLWYRTSSMRLAQPRGTKGVAIGIISIECGLGSLTLTLAATVFAWPAQLAIASIVLCAAGFILGGASLWKYIQSR